MEEDQHGYVYLDLEADDDPDDCAYRMSSTGSALHAATSMVSSASSAAGTTVCQDRPEFVRERPGDVKKRRNGQVAAG